MPADAPASVRAATLCVSAGLGTWLLATAASQHPHRLFDGLRRNDFTGMMVPNWRFFAPEPAIHDFHLLHRVLHADGTKTPWEETAPIIPRSWSQVAFFARRRQEKGMFDVGTELAVAMTRPDLDVTTTPAYEILRNRIEIKVLEDHAAGPRPKGFQFLVARGTGHDEQDEPDYLLSSPFIALRPA